MENKETITYVARYASDFVWPLKITEREILAHSLEEAREAAQKQRPGLILVGVRTKP